MPIPFVAYPTPINASLTYTLDSGASYTGVPYTHESGRQGQVCYIADGTPDMQGSTLNVSAAGFLPLRLRGFLKLTEADAYFLADDFALEQNAIAPAPIPPPSGPPNPLDIIMNVFNTTHPQLWTLEGCGQFCEDCCTALHEQHSPAWGHIHKDPGQNQYHGHAVDAVQLMINVAGTQAGIYDIIYSSVSSEAKPVFNYVEPPKPELWYYPADAGTRGLQVAVVNLRIPREVHHGDHRI